LKVLVDTPIWSLALRRQSRNLNPEQAELKSMFEELVRDGRVLIIGPIRQELLSGLREESQFNRLRDLLRAFPDPQLKIEDFEQAAQMTNDCSSRGIASTPTDMLICAVAYERKATVFTVDNDFKSYSRFLPIRLFQPGNA
jgi:predicted nucleic acid-binding protein